MFKTPSYHKSEYSVGAREHAQFSQLRDAIRRDTRTALSKFRLLGSVQIFIAIATIISGAALVAVTASTAGLPVFNPFALITGLVELLAGALAFLASRHGVREDKNRSRLNLMVKVHFGLNTLAVVLALIAVIMSGLAAALCSGWENQFFYEDYGARLEHDYERYCHPDQETKVALSALGIVSCTVLALWNCYTVCIYCAYGSLFGLAYKGQF